jgi:acetyl/propionyl-CoA carboxylase alpha subunit
VDVKAWTIAGGAAPQRVEADVRCARPAPGANPVITVLVGDTTHTFVAEPDGEGWLLRTAAPEGSGGPFRVVVAGEDVVIDGRRRTVREALSAAKGAVQSSPLIVTPSMPAVVTRVLVEDGAIVVKGDGVVAISAMKMEVTLRAPRAGTARVRVAVGDKVMPGDVLVDVVEHPLEVR